MKEWEDVRTDEWLFNKNIYCIIQYMYPNFKGRTGGYDERQWLCY